MKKHLLTAILLLATTIGNAQLYEQNGIRYSIISPNSVMTEASWDTGITDYDIPETIELDGKEYYVTRIGANLTSVSSESVRIPKTITQIDNRAFIRTESLTKVYIDDVAAWVGINFVGNDNNPLSGKNHSNLSVYVDGEKTRNIVLPETIGHISAKAFYRCYWLSSIQLPASLTIIHENSFYRCLGLKSITLPENINTIGDYAFSECEGLDSVIVKFNTPIELDGGHQFDDGTFIRATLYVPLGCKTAFQNAPVWSKFAKIEELADNTSVHSLRAAALAAGRAYTLNGTEAADHTRGFVIQDGKKAVRK